MTVVAAAAAEAASEASEAVPDAAEAAEAAAVASRDESSPRSCSVSRCDHALDGAVKTDGNSRAMLALLPILPLGLRLPPQPRKQPLHDLLVQRAVQSCCFTFRSCRDNPSADWLLRFHSHKGLEHFHGLDGLRLPWRRYLEELFDAPEEEIEVQSTLMKHRGLSPSNPFLQPTPMTYMHPIVPSQLGERVIQAACTIAKEWRSDLKLMGAENEEQMRRHEESIRTGTPDSKRETTLPVFSVDPEHGASAYRGGNYDLVKLLATRQALRSLLRECEERPSRAHEHEFLLRFSAAHPIDGEQPSHAADAWLAALLQQPYAIFSGQGGGGSGGGGAPTLLDPLVLAEDLMERRARLAEGWVDRLEAVPEEMLELKREWLSRTSERTADETR